MVVFPSLFFTAMSAKAQETSQDVALAARQEKARRAEQAERQSHVYTNEDLQKSRILIDGESVAASEKKSATPVATAGPAEQRSAVTSDAGKVSVAESLGEVARRYRREKAAHATEQAIEQANKIPATSSFHMEVAQPALAEIAPSQNSLRAKSPVAPASGKTAVRGTIGRRDPFSRRAIGMVPRVVGMPSSNIAASDATRFSAPQSPRGTDLPRSKETIAPGTPSSSAMSSVGVVRAIPVAPAVRRGAMETPRRRGDNAHADGSTLTMATGDSLWSLSRRYLGTGTRWREWLENNPGVSDPRRMRAGMRLTIPTPEKLLPAQAPAATSGTQTSITVKAGDSLWRISAERYGAGSHWPCLEQANPSLRNSGLIFPGQVLVIPASCENPEPKPSAAHR